MKDYTGIRIGRLTAIRCVGFKKYAHGKHYMWLMKCDCGNEKVIDIGSAIHGKVRSCGCLHHEITVKQMTKNLHHHEKLHRVWESMKNRCFRSGDSHGKYYLKRGITVCKEWMEFDKFYEWSMENGYCEGLSIDRIDNDGNYCPENCRWVDQYVQANNKSNNVKIEYQGRVLTPHQIENITGINRRLITSRLRRGWDVCSACTIRAGEIVNQHGKCKITKG